jgi:hypothetical protein
LEGLEEGGEGDLKVGTGDNFGLVVFAVGDLVALRYGCVVAVCGEEGLGEEGGGCGGALAAGSVSKHMQRTLHGAAFAHGELEALLAECYVRFVRKGDAAQEEVQLACGAGDRREDWRSVFVHGCYCWLCVMIEQDARDR